MFQIQSLPMAAGLFLIASVGVWFTASKLTKYLDLISDRTGMGKAFAGILLLGIATSLPEIATTGTAAVSGSSDLAVSNLMGGVSIQIALLAFIDFFAIKGRALTSRSPKAVLIMQGVILILTISMAIAAISAKEIFTFLNVGLWSLIIFITYVMGIFAVHRYGKDPKWSPRAEEKIENEDDTYKKVLKGKFKDVSTKNLVLRFGVMAAGVLTAGYFVTTSAEHIVKLTGISSSFIGATLLALATSLPEISTTWSAAKLGAYSMAIGNILGTNTLEVALLFPADLLYREGPIISKAGNSAVFLAGIGAILTCIYVWGMLERRDKTFLRMGIDSFLIILIYAGGMVVFGFMQK